MADIPINAVPRRVQFTGNTGLGPFAFSFEILLNTDIAVYKNSTLLTITTDYTVTINANGTGSVTLTGSGSGTALVASDYLTIIGDKPLARTTDFTTAGDLLASALNEQLDSSVVMTQQVSERVDRALRQDPDDVDGDMTIPDKATRLGKYLRFNDTTGDPEAGDVAGLYTSAGMNNYNFTGDGSATAFTLGIAPGAENNTQTYIDGVYQQKDTYTVSGTTLTFSTAPPNLSTIEVMVIQPLAAGENQASEISFKQDGSSVERNVQLKLQESVSVKDFGATGDGTTDDTAAIQAAIDYAGSLVTGGGEVIVPSGVYLITATITMVNSNVTLNFDQGSRFKATAAMTNMLEMGDGVNRKENIQIIGAPYFDANSLASYCVKDRGTRIGGVMDGYFQNFSEYAILSQPTTEDFSEFFNILKCQSFDGKGFFKHLATGPTPNSRGTDFYISENTCFRPTEWFASIDTAQRFHFTNNMVGSQTNAFLGGINITASDTNTASTVTAEHVINGLYVESNTEYADGAGIIAVNVTNTSTTPSLKTIQGCSTSNVLVQPANMVTIVKLNSPTTPYTIRAFEIGNIDAKDGFVDSIIIEANVVWTRILSANFQGAAIDFINDSGLHTVINGSMEINSGKSNPVTQGDTGDLIRNKANDSYWTKDLGGNFKQIGHGTIVYSETRDLPSIASNGNLILSIAVAGVTLGDYAQVAFELGLSGLIVSAYCRTGLVDISIYNPTVSAIDIASTTMRILVTKH